MSNLTVVMYHYVRELATSRYPGIKGLELSRFQSQLGYLRENFQFVTMGEVGHSLRTGDRLPDRAALLTFDDGYIEHYELCFPILVDAGIEGSFFPPVAPVRDRVLLDVNRVHFILAVKDSETLAAAIDRYVEERREDFGLQPVAHYRNQWAKPNRFDDAETIYVKRMLQVALPEALRNRIAKELFGQFVARDEDEFSAELYCSEQQFREMQAAGMYVGSHGCDHVWLNAVDASKQEQEVLGSLEFLRSIGSPVDDYWAMAYPYGGWNESLLAILRKAGCVAGFTTESAVASLDKHLPLLLPRLDTNDLPVS
jgi:peptidoglycan/xylan/chitin deacetylase (PgdA/CDA1 family)